MANYDNLILPLPYNNPFGTNVPFNKSKLGLSSRADKAIFPPPFVSEEIYAKKGKKIKKAKKPSVRQSQKVIQKVSIKIGDLSKAIKERETKDDKALVQRTSMMPPFQSSTQTYLRLENPGFYKYAQPLPQVIPNLYQASPSSVVQPLIPAETVKVSGKDLQPQKNAPIVQDTDPNDLQRNIRSHVRPREFTLNISQAGETGKQAMERIEEEYGLRRQSQASQASSSVADAVNESLRIQRLQRELENPQPPAQVIARNYFMNPLDQRQSLSSREAGYRPIQPIPPIPPML